MTCAEARDRILIADPQELVAGTASDLGRHLAECAACQALAARVLAAEDALRTERAAPPRRTPAEVAVRAAVAARRARVARRRLLWTAGPALAAALVVAAVLARREAHPAPSAPLAAAPTPPPLVEQGTGNVVVLNTDNPDIVVVWQF